MSFPRIKRSKKQRYPVVVPNTEPDLGEYIACGSLERPLYIRTAFRASFDEQQAFLFCPLRAFIRRHLSSFLCQVALIAYQYACQMWVRVGTYIRQPCSTMREA